MGASTQIPAQAANPLLEPSQLPYGVVPFDRLQPSDYENAVREGIKQHIQEIDAITSNPEAPTFENTIVALDRSGNTLTIAQLALSNVEHATGDTVLMRITSELTPELTRHSTDIMLNEKL